MASTPPDNHPGQQGLEGEQVRQPPSQALCLGPDTWGGVGPCSPIARPVPEVRRRRRAEAWGEEVPSYKLPQILPPPRSQRLRDLTVETQRLPWEVT